MTISLSDNHPQHSPAPWHKQPMVLLIVAIPAVAVIVSFIMLGIAIKTFDGVVVDDYYRHGKEINQLLHRDSHAQKLGIQARLAFKKNSVTVRMSAIVPLTWPDTLPLRILHPTQRGLDKIIELRRQQGNTYAAGIDPIQPGDWFLQIDTEQWRLNRRVAIRGESVIKIQSDPLSNMP